MLWIIISCFFLLQMIIGVLIDSINQQTGSALFTYLQRNWLRTEQNIAELKPLQPMKIPKSFIRNYVWMLVHSNAFQNVMTLIILVNVIFMATESYDQPQVRLRLHSIQTYIHTYIHTYIRNKQTNKQTNKQMPYCSP